jgi:hypothetical protein
MITGQPDTRVPSSAFRPLKNAELVGNSVHFQNRVSVMLGFQLRHWLFQPLPRLRLLPPYPRLEGRISQLFQVAKSDVASRDAILDYLRFLMNEQPSLPSFQYTNPFDQSAIPLPDCRSEIMATLWNFLSSLHSDLLQIDITSPSPYAPASSLLSEWLGIAEYYAEQVKFPFHPFFTRLSADFLRAYHGYVASIVFFVCFHVSPTVTPNIVLNTSVYCVAQAKIAIDTFPSDSDRVYKPVVEYVRQALIATAHFMRSKDGDASPACIKADLLKAQSELRRIPASCRFDPVTAFAADLGAAIEKSINECNAKFPRVRAERVVGELPPPREPSPITAKPIATLMGFVQADAANAERSVNNEFINGHFSLREMED